MLCGRRSCADDSHSMMMPAGFWYRCAGFLVGLFRCVTWSRLCDLFQQMRSAPNPLALWAAQ
jgi:hypothetical protein